MPYFDFGVELKAPGRGMVVWTLTREIGAAGMAERIRRHNDMAAFIEKVVGEHPNLELLQEPTLSICCFRYVSPDVGDLALLNQRLHRRLTRESKKCPAPRK